MAFHNKYRPNTIVIVNVEKKLIEKHYDFLDCKIKKGILYCYGNYQPTEESITYSYRIKYTPLSKPKVTVTSPKISYNDEIHMYDDTSLCLYYPKDMTWDCSSHHLYDTIIPWTHEWFVFYELYQFTGKWLHPEVRHKKGDKK
jgi:hypothetical protein